MVPCKYIVLIYFETNCQTYLIETLNKKKAF